MASIEIHKSNIRSSSDLDVRREPHWGAPLETGLFLGFRKLDEDGAGTWIARQRDEDKRQKYESLGNVALVSYAVAATAARAWAKKLANGINADEVKTVGDACAAYVKARRRDKGDKNADTTAKIYARHVLSNKAFAGIELAKLKTNQILDWRAALVMNERSRNNILDTLRAALNHAVASEYVDGVRAIQWKKIAIQTTKGRRNVVLKPAQRAALLDALPPVIRPFIAALCLLPLRPGAMAQLTVGHIETHRVDGKVIAMLHVEFDKYNADRRIPLSAAALALLKENAKGKTPAAPIFADETGAAWTKDTWKGHMLAARKAAGLPANTVAYSLRHSTITDMLTAGVDSLTVARISGTSIQKIEEHYGHLLDKHGAEALEKLAALAVNLKTR
jgi:hypothetical protein